MYFYWDTIVSMVHDGQAIVSIHFQSSVVYQVTNRARFNIIIIAPVSKPVHSRFTTDSLLPSTLQFIALFCVINS